METEETSILTIKHSNDYLFTIKNEEFNSISLNRSYVNNRNMETKYDVNIYSKNVFKQIHPNNNRKELINDLLTRSNTNISKLLQNTNEEIKQKITVNTLVDKYRKFYPLASEKKLREVIEDNYKSIIDHINNLIKNDDIISELIFDIIFERGECYNNFTNILYISILNRSKDKINSNINQTIFNNLINSCFRFNNTETLGAVYQTKKFMNERLFKGKANRMINDTFKKLEILGIISYIVRDKESCDKDIKEYTDNLKNSHGHYYNDPKIQMHKKIHTNTLLFPVLNFKSMINCIDLEKDSNVKDLIDLFFKDISYNICTHNYVMFFINKLMEGGNIENILKYMEDNKILTIRDTVINIKTCDSFLDIDSYYKKLEKNSKNVDEKIKEYSNMNFKKSIMVDPSLTYDMSVLFKEYIKETLNEELITEETITQFMNNIQNVDKEKVIVNSIQNQIIGLKEETKAKEEKYGSNYNGFIKTEKVSDIKTLLQLLTDKYGLDNKEYFANRRFPLLSIVMEVFNRRETEDQLNILFKMKKYLFNKSNKPIFVLNDISEFLMYLNSLKIGE